MDAHRGNFRPVSGTSNNRRFPTLSREPAQELKRTNFYLLIFAACRFSLLNCSFLLLNLCVTATDLTVWTISALLAIGVGWSRYAKWKTRDKIVRELAAMDPERREKVLSRMTPQLAMEARQELMRRFHIS
jgi:hypothetical protein